MARQTIRRQSLELPDRRALVASFTLHRRVSAEKRKSVQVILDCAQTDLPSTNGVALRAVGAEFSPVNIRVTIGAIFADIGEHRFHMALRAENFFVHAAQRIAGLIVIELGDRADGTPPGIGVAISARNRKWAVRTSGAPSLCKNTWSEEHETPQQPDSGLSEPGRKLPLARDRTWWRVESVKFIQILGPEISDNNCTEGHVLGIGIFCSHHSVNMTCAGLGFKNSDATNREKVVA
jgi:hypothetical protein